MEQFHLVGRRSKSSRQEDEFKGEVSHAANWSPSHMLQSQVPKQRIWARDDCAASCTFVPSPPLWVRPAEGEFPGYVGRSQWAAVGSAVGPLVM